jgi:hypothetical protein
MIRFLSIVLPLVCLLLTIEQCASVRLITVSERNLNEADSLFSSGDYLHAKIAYTKIRDIEQDSNIVQEAQYKLGYLNVFYNNPYGDWEEALREFTRYQSRFPLGRRADEINSWVTILHTIESYQDGYNSSFTQAKDLKNRTSDEVKKVNTLMEGMLKCATIKDSLSNEVNFLSRKVKDMEELILKVQKIGSH